MARAFLHRTMVPIYCSCSRKINSFRSEGKGPPQPWKPNPIGHAELTFFIKDRVLADRHRDQPDLFALAIGRILVDRDAKPVRSENIEVLHHSDFVGSGEIKFLRSVRILT
jgi:hypothetical protein